MAFVKACLVVILVTVTHALMTPQAAPGAVAAKEDASTMTSDQCVNYLKQWRPNEDKVSEQFFRDNADYALKARSFPYGEQVSKDMFLKYVLPYSHFDEARDDWRAHMFQTLHPFVKDKKTLQEAAEALFPVWSNAFGKQLEFKADMTPQIMAPITETLKNGFASCTGMSIFLADCMRSVGIPARVVGTNAWNRESKGNHNWVEVWMGDHWNFVDAVPTGNLVAWNQTWFKEQAAKQVSSPIENAILSPLWGPEANTVYNLSWRIPSQFVPAIDVTASYAGKPLPEATFVFIPASFIVILLAVATLGGAGFIYKKNKEKYGWERMA